MSFTELGRGYEIYKDEYNKAAIEALESGMYILGSRVEKFEKEFADYIGSEYCVGLNSGLDALILAFRALEIGEGDEVIVPANTYIASLLAISENGATPILVEPDEYYNIDVNKIEEKITEKTKAILVVHLYGQACNMKKVKGIAEKHNLFIVEDCAQSHGAKYNGINTGICGDIGCFSFYPTKNVGAFGDAGAIVANNAQLAEKIKMLRNYGSKIKYKNEMLGINSRLDEIQASLLSVKLSHYDELKRQREDIAKLYLSKIKNEKVQLPKLADDCTSVWHLFVVKTKERDELQQYLRENGIDTQIHYPIPPHLSDAYSYLGHKEGSLPITEDYSKTVLSLPLYDGITIEEVLYVIDIINKY